VLVMVKQDLLLVCVVEVRRWVLVLVMVALG
jgi:hypothetical protein